MCAAFVLSASAATCGCTAGPQEAPRLRSLAVTIPLEPAFDPDVTEYQATIAKRRSGFTLAAEGEHSDHAVTLTAVGAASVVDLGPNARWYRVGIEPLIIDATVDDGERSRNYTLVVTRESP